MILSLFTDRTKYITYEFGAEVVSCDAADNPNGLYEFIESTFIAFYCTDNDAILQIGDGRYSIKDTSISVEFYNNCDQCKVTIKKDMQSLLELSYAPWWNRRSPNFIVAFGQPEDDEEDLLAYISMMCRSADSRAHLMNVYSGNYSGPL